MNTLVSLKNTYNDFRQSYEIDLAGAKGELKNSLAYGEIYGLALEEKLVLVYLANEQSISKNILQLLECYKEKRVDDTYCFVIAAGKKVPREEIPEIFHKDIVLPSSKKSIEAFATAKYIIANGKLPRYFVKKDEQKVIQVLDRSNENISKSLRSQNKISCMLNSSVFFVKEEDKDKILKDYAIPEEYTNCVKIINEEDFGHETLKEMCNITAVQQKKKKNIILLVSSWKLGGHEETYIRLIANNIDYSKYDLTLVTKRPQNGNGEEVLQDINENVRIIYRKGTFSCTKDEYIKTQYLLKNFDSFKDFEKAYEKVDTSVMARECRRILGTMQFDELIYIGSHSAVWSMFAKCMRAQYKLRVINHSLQEELYGYTTQTKQLGFSNKIAMYDHIFQEIVFTSVEYEENARKEKYFKHPKISSFEFPNAMSEENTQIKPQYVEYDGKKYLIGQKYEYLHGGMRVVLFPVPREDQKAYIANGDMCDSDTLLAMFSKIDEQSKDSLFVIYGKDADNIRQSAKKYGLDKKIEIMERKTLETIEMPEQYLQSFEGCLITYEREEYCLISAVMELIGKKIITFQDGKLIEHRESKFHNIKEYNTYVQGLWNQFLDGKIN